MMFSLIIFYSSAIDGHSKRKVLEIFNMNYKNVFSFLKVIPWFCTAHLLLRITICPPLKRACEVTLLK